MTTNGPIKTFTKKMAGLRADIDRMKRLNAEKAKEITVLVKTLWKAEPVLSTNRDVSDKYRRVWLRVCIVLAKYEKKKDK